MRTAIGIDLGGTNVKGVLVNESGEVIHHAASATYSAGCGSANTAAEEGDHWKRKVAEMVREMQSKSPDPVVAIGVAAPGLSDGMNTCIRVMPERLNGLENFVWSDYLGQQVWVLNDAHAALMAEAKFGAGKGVKNIVMITWGTGVGGGVLINGELFQGNYQIAGHIGHITMDVASTYPDITGVPGTLEDAIGDATVGRRSCGRFSSTFELVQAHRRGDPFASYIWLSSVRVLSLALCSIYNLLSPDIVILGGGVTRAADDLYKPLRAFIDAYEWKNKPHTPPVLQAEFGDLAGAVGAAGFALSKFDNS